MVALDYPKIVILGWIAALSFFLLFPTNLTLFLFVVFNGIVFLDFGIFYLSSAMHKDFIRDFRKSLITSWILFLSPLLFFSHYLNRIFFMFCMGLAAIKFVHYRWEQYTSVYAHRTTTDLDILASVTEQRQRQGNTALDMAKRGTSDSGLIKRHARQPSSLLSPSSASAAAAAIQQPSI